MIQAPRSVPRSPARLRGLAPLLLAACAWALIGCASGDEVSDRPLGEFVKSITGPTPGEAARGAFHRYDADVRRRNVALLADAPFGGEEPYLRMYRLLLDDPAPTVRAACIRALGRHGASRDVEVLLPLLRDDNDFVRWEAAKAMCRLHHPAAIDDLIRLVNEDEDVDVRMAAARALGQYPRARVFDALVGALDDLDYGVSQAAADSLRTLTGRDFDRDARAWLAWSRDHRRRLFDAGGAYTYEPYRAPPGFLHRYLVDPLIFWKDREQPEPRVPAGIDRQG